MNDDKGIIIYIYAHEPYCRALAADDQMGQGVHFATVCLIQRRVVLEES